MVDYESLKGMIAQTMRVRLKTQTIIAEEEFDTLEDEQHVEQDVNDEEDSQPNEAPLSSPVIQEVAQLLPSIQKSPALYESHWIYCVDSRGQTGYCSSSATFYNQVNILTLELN